jgi:hypothetical protein
MSKGERNNKSFRTESCKEETWWNKAIEQSVNRKKAAYRKWLTSRTPDYKKAYRELSRISKERQSKC